MNHFCLGSIRNYAVLHIALSECRVFQTKERAPYMIAVELYRPDELNLYSTGQGHKNPHSHEHGTGNDFQLNKNIFDNLRANDNGAESSDDSFRVDHDETPNQKGYDRIKINHDEENPYILEINQRQRSKSLKKQTREKSNGAGANQSRKSKNLPTSGAP